MHSTFIPADCYNLALTLNSGQAFRWEPFEGGWESAVGNRWVRLVEEPGGIRAFTLADPGDWSWLRRYLQSDFDLHAALATFPEDPHLPKAIDACRGLRLLRQDPWECLASFILSSTKQIVQIRQIIALLSRRFGEPIQVPAGRPELFQFPAASRLAGCTEAELRECKMGFRAPYLLDAARRVAGGQIDLNGLAALPLGEARARLIEIDGVGRKIADCALLFSCGFPEAFPVDVWIARAIRTLYFPRRRPSSARLEKFIAGYFGPHGGLAQQYLFHYMRVHAAPK